MPRPASGRWARLKVIPRCSEGSTSGRTGEASSSPTQGNVGGSPTPDPAGRRRSHSAPRTWCKNLAGALSAMRDTPGPTARISTRKGSQSFGWQTGPYNALDRLGPKDRSFLGSFTRHGIAGVGGMPTVLEEPESRRIKSRFVYVSQGLPLFHFVSPRLGNPLREVNSTVSTQNVREHAGDR